MRYFIAVLVGLSLLTVSIPANAAIAPGFQIRTVIQTD